MAVGIDAVLTERSDGFYDFSIGPNGDILSSDSFDTAIITTLFTDARAPASLVSLPEKQRGWIGNESTPGFQIGSTLWVYTEQSRLTGSTVRGVTDAATKSLQWFVEDDIAVRVVGETEVSTNKLTLEVTITSPDSSVSKRYFDIWKATGQS